MLKPLPTSIQTFSKIIEGGYLYVDKTQYLYELIRELSGVYFLARPRRFGKSLLISTLEEIFKGHKELFQGLWLYDSPYTWQTHPVIRVDFSQESVNSKTALIDVIKAYLQEIASDQGITLADGPYQRQLRWLIQQLATKNQVVILIDEYDKPIIDNLENLKVAQEIQEVLKDFYTVIKAMDQYIRFVFITGISKFSRVGVFSAMNNLTDLTQSPRFATMLGLTETEIKENFQPYISAFAQQENISETTLLKRIRRWYNGFCFVGNSQQLYNPFSTLHLFYHQRFANYWFETGTPTFLIKLIKEQKYDVTQLNNLELREMAFSTYDLENLAVIPLLFQTGYLTIKAYEPTTRKYTLSYPNDEVEDAFLVHLLGAFSNVKQGLNEAYLWQLIDALEAQDLEHFFEILNIFFANIDYQLYIKDEKYYQTIFYLIFLLLGLRVEAEVKTNRGRIDAVVELKAAIYIFEFKLDGNAEDALKQIKEKAYYQKYRSKDKPVTLVGANFDSQKREVSEWQSELDSQRSSD